MMERPQGMVAVVRSLKNSGLAVTVMENGAEFTLTPNDNLNPAQNMYFEEIYGLKEPDTNKLMSEKTPEKLVEECVTRDLKDFNYDCGKAFYQNYDVRHVKAKFGTNGKARQLHPCSIIHEASENCTPAVDSEIQASALMVNKEVTTMPLVAKPKRSVACSSHFDSSIEGEVSHPYVHIRPICNTMHSSVSSIEICKVNFSNYDIHVQRKAKSEINCSSGNLSFLSSLEEVFKREGSGTHLIEEFSVKMKKTMIDSINEEGRFRKDKNSNLGGVKFDTVTTHVYRAAVMPKRFAQEYERIIRDWLNEIPLNIQYFSSKSLNMKMVIEDFVERVKGVVYAVKSSDHNEEKLKSFVIENLDKLPIDSSAYFNKKSYLNRLTNDLLNKLQCNSLPSISRQSRKSIVNIAVEMYRPNGGVLRDALSKEMNNFLQELEIDFSQRQLDSIKFEIVHSLIRNLNDVIADTDEMVRKEIELILKENGGLGEFQALYLARVILEDLKGIIKMFDAVSTAENSTTDMIDYTAGTSALQCSFESKTFNFIDDAITNYNNSVNMYRNVLMQQIESWLQKAQFYVPRTRDPTYRRVVAADLVRNIVDRQKYLMLKPSGQVSRQEEREFLKYQIFRWTINVLGGDQKGIASLLPDLVARIGSVNNADLLGIRELKSFNKSLTIKSGRSKKFEEPAGKYGKTMNASNDNTNHETPTTSGLTKSYGAFDYYENISKQRFVKEFEPFYDNNAMCQSSFFGSNSLFNQISNESCNESHSYKLEKELETCIKTWTQELPIPLSPEQKPFIEKIKLEIGSEIMAAITAMKSQPSVMTNYMYFEYVLEEKLDKLLDHLPKSQQLSNNLEKLKAKLIEKITDINLKYGMLCDPEQFREQLTGSLEVYVPRDKTDVFREDPVKLEEDLALKYLVDDFILFVFFRNTKNLLSEKYSKKLMQGIENFVDKLKAHYNKELKDIDKEMYIQELLSAPLRIPIPNDYIIEEEANKILLGIAIEEWYNGLPIPHGRDLKELLKRRKLRDGLVNRFYTRSFSCDNTDYKKAIKNDITGFLRMLPLTECQNLNMKNIVDDLVNRTEIRCRFWDEFSPNKPHNETTCSGYDAYNELAKNVPYNSNDQHSRVTDIKFAEYNLNFPSHTIRYDKNQSSKRVSSYGRTLSTFLQSSNGTSHTPVSKQNQSTNSASSGSIPPNHSPNQNQMQPGFSPDYPKLSGSVSLQLSDDGSRYTPVNIDQTNTGSFGQSLSRTPPRSSSQSADLLSGSYGQPLSESVARPETVSRPQAQEELNIEFDKYVNDWAQQVPMPMPRTPDEEEIVKKLRLGLVKGVYNALFKLKEQPRVIHNTFYFEDGFDDEMEALISLVPETPELQAQKRVLKINIIKKASWYVKSSRQIAYPDLYKNEALEKIACKTRMFVPQRTNAKVNSLDTSQFREDLLLLNIVEDYMLAINYQDADRIRATAYKQRLMRRIQEFVDEMKNNNCCELKNIDKATLINEIVKEFQTLPPPSDETIRDEVDGILLGIDIENWYNSLPLAHDNNIGEHLIRRKLRDDLVQGIKDMEKTASLDGSDPERPMRHEISKFLERMPLGKDQVLNINNMVDNLMYIVRNRQRLQPSIRSLRPANRTVDFKSPERYESFGPPIASSSARSVGVDQTRSVQHTSVASVESDSKSMQSSKSAPKSHNQQGSGPLLSGSCGQTLGRTPPNTSSGANCHQTPSGQPVPSSLGQPLSESIARPESVARPQTQDELNMEFDKFVNDWAQHVPMPTPKTPEEEEIVRKLRLGLVKGVYNALFKLKEQPQVIHNTFYFEDGFDDEMEALLSLVPETPELQTQKPVLKINMIKKASWYVKSSRQLALPDLYEEEAMKKIACKACTFVPQRAHARVDSLDNTQFEEDLLLLNIVEDYILAMNYQDTDRVKAAAYKQRLMNRIQEFVGELKRNHNVQLKEVDKVTLINEIIKEFQTMPPPCNDNFRDEADGILLGIEIENWYNNLPIVHENNLGEQLIRRKMRDDLVQGIKDMEKTASLDGSDPERPMRYEISKFLERMPLVRDQDLNINKMVDDVMNIVRNRQRLQTSVGPSMQVDRSVDLSGPDRYESFGPPVASSSVRSVGIDQTRLPQQTANSSVKSGAASLQSSDDGSRYNPTSFNQQNSSPLLSGSYGQPFSRSPPTASSGSSRHKTPSGQPLSVSFGQTLSESIARSENVARPQTQDVLNMEFDKFVIDWAQQVPMPTPRTPDEEEIVKKLRLGLVNGVYNALFKLKEQPQVIHNTFYFEDGFDDEMEALLSLVPETPELQTQKRVLKINIIKKASWYVKSSRHIAYPDLYKNEALAKIAGKVCTFVPQRIHAKVDSLDNTQFEEDLMLLNIVEDYVLAMNYQNADRVRATAYQQRLMKRIQEFVEEFKRNHNVQLKNVDKAVLINEIVKEFQTLPLPSNDTIRDEADGILLGIEIENWYNNLPIVHENNVGEHLIRRKLRDDLVQGIKDMEKTASLDGSDPERPMRHEISKFLERMPLGRDQDLNINDMVDNLMNIVRNRQTLQPFIRPIRPTDLNIPDRYESFSPPIASSSAHSNACVQNQLCSDQLCQSTLSQSSTYSSGMHQSPQVRSPSPAIGQSPLTGVTQDFGKSQSMKSEDISYKTLDEGSKPPGLWNSGSEKPASASNQTQSTNRPVDFSIPNRYESLGPPVGHSSFRPTGSIQTQSEQQTVDYSKQSGPASMQSSGGVSRYTPTSPNQPDSDIMLSGSYGQPLGRTPDQITSRQQLPGSFRPPITETVARPDYVMSPQTEEDLNSEFEKIVEEWAELVPMPIPQTPDEEEIVNKMRLGLVKGVYNILTNIREKPKVIKNTFYFEDEFDDEIEALLDLVPETPEFQVKKHYIKIDIIKKASWYAKSLRRMRYPRFHRDQAASKIASIVHRFAPKSRTKFAGIDLDRLDVDLLLLGIVDDYMLTLSYQDSDRVKAEAHRRRLMKRTHELAEDIKKKNCCTLKQSDKNAIINEILKELETLPVPSNESIANEADEILLGIEIENWYNNLPLPHTNDVSERLVRRKLRDDMVQGIKDMENTADADNTDPERPMRHEISKFLGRMPLVKDESLNINKMVEELINIVKRRVGTSTSLSIRDRSVGSSVPARYESLGAPVASSTVRSPTLQTPAGQSTSFPGQRRQWTTPGPLPNTQYPSSGIPPMDFSSSQSSNSCKQGRALSPGSPTQGSSEIPQRSHQSKPSPKSDRGSSDNIQWKSLAMGTQNTWNISRPDASSGSSQTSKAGSGFQSRRGNILQESGRMSPSQWQPVGESTRIDQSSPRSADASTSSSFGQNASPQFQQPPRLIPAVTFGSRELRQGAIFGAGQSQSIRSDDVSWKSLSTAQCNSNCASPSCKNSTRGRQMAQTTQAGSSISPSPTYSQSPPAAQQMYGQVPQDQSSDVSNKTMAQGTPPPEYWSSGRDATENIWHRNLEPGDYGAFERSRPFSSTIRQGMPPSLRVPAQIQGGTPVSNLSPPPRSPRMQAGSPLTPEEILYRPGSLLQVPFPASPYGTPTTPPFHPNQPQISIPYPRKIFGHDGRSGLPISGMSTSEKMKVCGCPKGHPSVDSHMRHVPYSPGIPQQHGRGRYGPIRRIVCPPVSAEPFKYCPRMHNMPVRCECPVGYECYLNQEDRYNNSQCYQQGN